MFCKTKKPRNKHAKVFLSKSAILAALKNPPEPCPFKIILFSIVDFLEKISAKATARFCISSSTPKLALKELRLGSNSQKCDESKPRTSRCPNSFNNLDETNKISAQFLVIKIRLGILGH